MLNAALCIIVAYSPNRDIGNFTGTFCIARHSGAIEAKVGRKLRIRSLRSSHDGPLQIEARILKKNPSSRLSRSPHYSEKCLNDRALARPAKPGWPVG
jgi:hypothetical protein